MSLKQLTDKQLVTELKTLPLLSISRELVLQEMGRRVAEEIRALTNRQ